MGRRFAKQQSFPKTAPYMSLNYGASCSGSVSDGCHHPSILEEQVILRNLERLTSKALLITCGRTGVESLSDGGIMVEDTQSDSDANVRCIFVRLSHEVALWPLPIARCRNRLVGSYHQLCAWYEQNAGGRIPTNLKNCLERSSANTSMASGQGSLSSTTATRSFGKGTGQNSCAESRGLQFE